MEDAKALPRKFRELSNDALSIISVSGVYGARKERLLREIMRVDSVTWDEAYQKLMEINKENDRYAWVVTFPFRISAFLGLSAAVSAIPLVFHKPTAVWFNDNFVHEDLPEGGIESLDTIWKVGNWTWGWMEPYLGTASFVLLGFQMTRIHMQKINYKPYTETVLVWRANRLSKKFPQYEKQIVSDFAVVDPWHN